MKDFSLHWRVLYTTSRRATSRKYDFHGKKELLHAKPRVIDSKELKKLKPAFPHVHGPVGPVSQDVMSWNVAKG